MRRIDGTSLEISPLCLGGNVFGWTVNETEAFAVLDAFEAAGGNFIDTADKYSDWADGNSGGESEKIIGKWMAARGNRDRLVIGTKVGTLAGSRGLGAAAIRSGIEASLRRLQTDHVDLYYAHEDDLASRQDETLRAFDQVVREGKARQIAAKAAAGFKLYNQDYRGRSAERGEDLVGEVISL